MLTTYRSLIRGQTRTALVFAHRFPLRTVAGPPPVPVYADRRRPVDSQHRTSCRQRQQRPNDRTLAGQRAPQSGSSAPYRGRRRARSVKPRPTQDGPHGWRAVNGCDSSALDRLNVRGGRALGALLGVVGHLRALAERLEAAAGDRRVMAEEVLALVIGRDEAKALLVAEPLNGSSCHVFPPGRLCAAKRGRCSGQQLRTLAPLSPGTMFRPLSASVAASAGQLSWPSSATNARRSMLGRSESCVASRV